jgi:hypothetical protein
VSKSVENAVKKLQPNAAAVKTSKVGQRVPERLNMSKRFNGLSQTCLRRLTSGHLRPQSWPKKVQPGAAGGKIGDTYSNRVGETRVQRHDRTLAGRSVSAKQQSSFLIVQTVLARHVFCEKRLRRVRGFSIVNHQA